MKRSNKAVRVAVIGFLALIVLVPSGWFIGTRFCLDRYALSTDWQTITFNDKTYHPQNVSYAAEEDLQKALDYMNACIGKTIGVAVFPRRTVTDLIWPVWVTEYDGDKTHKHIFVRGPMDVGTVYVKQQP